MAIEDILFYGLAIVAMISALLVIFIRNPVYSALFLALCMSALGAMFFTLNAYFIAVAQITVYAGAVMVLFVMVVMLFDLRKESEEILRLSPVSLAKVLATALLCGFLVGTGWLGYTALSENPAATQPHAPTLTSTLAPESNVAATKNPDEDLTGAEAAKLVDQAPAASMITSPPEVDSTVALSRILFSKFVFAFEAVSVLLLVAIVGTVALAKSKGGTHHVAP
jgi:NADH-quinone oxidoreductase subunit J